MITPDKAQALLKGATPGPYELEESGEQWADCPPSHSMQITSRDGHALVQKEVSERVADEWHATFELMATAPDMAKQIANMRWEYAVELQYEPDRWELYKHTNLFALITTEVPANGRWFDTIKQAQEHAKTTKYPTRIVRRLASTELEVIE
ncbi:hypothetical protein [Corynebacterium pseudopelargi]|uniref:Uncharacterized protein n=1 Tax=Corynebacterium pseudopelargi TaxID=2080757 RepID=A0A3G6IXL5_9CORY|nr:hypothetical protein [Corynebacterium pseudopelargi]AZA08714.1 hypothetical protein CPPEL_02915 [Corynebacterium pseudopelargi]